MIKVNNQLTLKIEIFLDYLKGLMPSQKSFKMKDKEEDVRTDTETRVF